MGAKTFTGKDGWIRWAVEWALQEIQTPEAQKALVEPKGH
jgi:hypothetical protein